jgi:hypothetical protein
VFSFSPSVSGSYSVISRAAKHTWRIAS